MNAAQIRQMLIGEWISSILEQHGEFKGDKKVSARGKLYKACSFPSLNKCVQFWANSPDKRLQAQAKSLLRKSTNPKEFDVILGLMAGVICIHEDEDQIHLRPLQVGVIDIILLG